MVTIGGFVIDAAPTESHTFDSTVTEHPIEEGSDVTDHVRVRPDRVSIEGIVSNTPIGEVKAIRDSESPFAGEILPAPDAYAYLKQIRANREPVTVDTSLEKYENMILTSLVVPQNAQTGDAFRFRATFQEIQIVKTERASRRVAVARAQRKDNRGAKTSEPVAESTALEDQERFINQQRKQFGMTYNSSKL